MTTAYFLLGRIPRNLWAPSDNCISPLQHVSMTSLPKWEELARDGCCGIFLFCCYRRSTHLHTLSKLGKSEGRTKASYIFFVLWERSFLYGCQRDLGSHQALSPSLRVLYGEPGYEVNEHCAYNHYAICALLLRLLFLAGTNFSILVVCSIWQVLILAILKDYLCFKKKKN